MSTDISLCVMWAYNSTQVWYFILSRPTMKAAGQIILLCVVLYSVRSHCNTRKIRLTLDCIQMKYIASLKSATCLWKFAVCFANDRCAYTFSVSSPGIITFLKRIRVLVTFLATFVQSSIFLSVTHIIYIKSEQNNPQKQRFLKNVFFNTYFLEWSEIKKWKNFNHHGRKTIGNKTCWDKMKVQIFRAIHVSITIVLNSLRQEKDQIPVIELLINSKHWFLN